LLYEQEFLSMQFSLTESFVVTSAGGSEGFSDSQRPREIAPPTESR